jgi:hypothetical protein
MLFGSGGSLERVGRRAPFAGGCLAGEYESRHAGPGELLELSGEVLAAATLRVYCLPHIVVKLPHSDRLVAVAFPPDRKQIGKHLTAAIAFLGLAHPLGRILATERK